MKIEDVTKNLNHSIVELENDINLLNMNTTSPSRIYRYIRHDLGQYILAFEYYLAVKSNIRDIKVHELSFINAIDYCIERHLINKDFGDLCKNSLQILRPLFRSAFEPKLEVLLDFYKSNEILFKANIKVIGRNINK